MSAQEYGRHEIVTALEAWGIIKRTAEQMQNIAKQQLRADNPEMLLDPYRVVEVRSRIATMAYYLHGLAQLTGLDEPEDVKADSTEIKSNAESIWQQLQILTKTMQAIANDVVELGITPLSPVRIREIRNSLRVAYLYVAALKARQQSEHDKAAEGN